VNRSFILPIILLALFACSCSSSLVYSPSTMLPARPLTTHQGQIIACVEMLPETRPQEVGRFSVLGGGGTIRYAFSDRVTLGGKGWSELIHGDTRRGGLSLEGIVMTGRDSTSLLWGLMPRVAMVFGEGLFSDGQGAALSAVFWFPVTSYLTPYVALGPVLGVRNFQEEWGYGVIGNAGVTVRLIEKLYLSLELSGIAQYNVHDDVASGVLAPAAALSLIP
jgi:hypothetical protein